VVAEEMGRRGRQRAIEAFAWPSVVQRFLELWDDQFARVRQATPGPCAFVDYNRLLSHYAHEFVSDEDYLALADVGSQTGQKMEGWTFSEPADAYTINQILARCVEGRFALAT